MLPGGATDLHACSADRTCGEFRSPMRLMETCPSTGSGKSGTPWGLHAGGMGPAQVRPARLAMPRLGTAARCRDQAGG